MPKTADLDEDLMTGLKLARKKPLNFCLIAKGVEVVKLIVQKKKIPDGEAQKAKAEFKGNKTIMGVVAGDGVELSFQVVGEEPSIPSKKIKEFISEQTGMTLKPKWEVVTELAEVEEAESEGEQASVPPPPVAPPPPPTATTPPPPLHQHLLRRRIQKFPHHRPLHRLICCRSWWPR